MAPLHPLDPVRAEHAVGLEHQGDDHHHVGREVLGAAADVGVEVAGGQALDQADDEATYHGAEDGIETAEDDHRKHLEAHQHQVDVDAQHAAPDDAAERRDGAGHGPGQREIALDVDAHGHGHLLVVGHRAHGHAHAALEEEPGEDAEEGQRDDHAQDLDRRQRGGPDDDRA